MNILFFYDVGIDPLAGGVSKITYLIATILRKRSHNVFFLGYIKSKKEYDKQQYFLPNKVLLSDENKKFLFDFLCKNNIQRVINQASLNPNLSSFIFLVKTQKIKLYSVIHSTILSRFENAAYLYENRLKQKKLSFLFPILKKRIIINLIKKIYWLKKSGHYKRMHHCCDKIIAVSPNNIADIQCMLGLKYDDKIVAINNGIILPSFIYNSSLKKHTILWVGTTDFYIKRVDILLSVWKQIQNKIPDWDLKIIGDGVDLINAQSLANDLSLERIEFVGRVTPEEHYEKASLLCMTSVSESFGLVLIEAMSYGVIPLAFNSFPAATEIIQDGINGFLIDPFDISQYAYKLLSLCLCSNQELSKIAHNCIGQAKQFDINIIVTEWENVLAGNGNYT